MQDPAGNWFEILPTEHRCRAGVNRRLTGEACLLPPSGSAGAVEGLDGSAEVPVMPQSAGPRRLQAASVPSLGQQVVRNLQQACGQGNVRKAPGPFPQGGAINGQFEAALGIGVVSVAERGEDDGN